MDIQGEIGHAHTAVRDEYQLPAVLSIVLVTIRVGVRAPLARGLWTEEESPRESNWYSNDFGFR